MCGFVLIVAALDQVRRGEGADTTAWILVALALAAGACLAFGVASGRWWSLAWTTGWFVAAVLVSHAVAELAGYNDRVVAEPVYLLAYLPVIVAATALGVVVTAVRRRGDDGRESPG